MKLLRHPFFFALLLTLLGASGCGSSTSTAGFVTPTPLPAQPLVTWTGQVASIAPGTNAITLAAPVQGYASVVLTGRTTVVDAQGNRLTANDIQPGMNIEVSGPQVTSDVFTAGGVRLLNGPPAAAPSLAPGLESADALSAVNVVQNFLSALVSDASGVTSGQYLTARLQAQVHSGTPVPNALGLPPRYPSFTLAPAQSGPVPGTVIVPATFNLDPPIGRVFTLLKENGVWRIDAAAVP